MREFATIEESDARLLFEIQSVEERFVKRWLIHSVIKKGYLEMIRALNRCASINIE